MSLCACVLRSHGYDRFSRNARSKVILSHAACTVQHSTRLGRANSKEIARMCHVCMLCERSMAVPVPRALQSQLESTQSHSQQIEASVGDFFLNGAQGQARFAGIAGIARAPYCGHCR
jgi:hypothetical protein